jgi:hypothetical protein
MACGHLLRDDWPVLDHRSGTRRRRAAEARPRTRTEAGPGTGAPAGTEGTRPAAAACRLFGVTARFAGAGNDTRFAFALQRAARDETGRPSAASSAPAGAQGPAAPAGRDGAAARVRDAASPARDARAGEVAPRCRFPAGGANNQREDTASGRCHRRGDVRACACPGRRRRSARRGHGSNRDPPRLSALSRRRGVRRDRWRSRWRAHCHDRLDIGVGRCADRLSRSWARQGAGRRSWHRQRSGRGRREREYHEVGAEFGRRGRAVRVRPCPPQRR